MLCFLNFSLPFGCVHLPIVFSSSFSYCYFVAIVLSGKTNLLGNTRGAVVRGGDVPYPHRTMALLPSLPRILDKFNANFNLTILLIGAKNQMC